MISLGCTDYKKVTSTTLWQYGTVNTNSPGQNGRIELNKPKHNSTKLLYGDKA